MNSDLVGSFLTDPKTHLGQVAEALGIPEKGKLPAVARALGLDVANFRKAVNKGKVPLGWEDRLRKALNGAASAPEEPEHEEPIAPIQVSKDTATAATAEVPVQEPVQEPMPEAESAASPESTAPPLSSDIHIAIGDGVAAELTVYPSTWSALVHKLLTKPERSTVTTAEYAALPVPNRDAEKARHGYVVPANFVPLTTPTESGSYRSYRCKENVQAIYALKLDIELNKAGAARLAVDPGAPKGNASLDAIATALEGFEMVIHETRSSRPDDRRHRVYVLLGEGGLEPAAAHRLAHHLCDRLEAAGIAVDRGSSTDLSKPAFMPSLSSDQEWRAQHVPGRPARIADVPDGYDAPTRPATPVQVDVPAWEPVDLDALDLPDSVKARIRDGAELEQPRHQAIYGACCAMLRARIAPDVILRVLADPDHGISDKVLGEWGEGDRQHGMAHVAKYVLPAAIEETAVTFRVAEDGEVHTGPPSLLDWLDKHQLPALRQRVQEAHDTFEGALPDDEPDGFRERFQRLTEAYVQGEEFGFAKELKAGKQPFDLPKSDMLKKVQELADMLHAVQGAERRCFGLEQAIETLRADDDVSRVPTQWVQAYRDEFFREDEDPAATVQMKRDALAEACADILERKDILAAVVEAAHRLGVAGEEQTITSLYMMATTRFFESANHCKVYGESSSGKSFTTDTVLMKLLPAGEVIEISNMSPKALIDMEGLQHKILYAVEATMLQTADLADERSLMIRELISRGRLTHHRSIRDEETGQFETQTIVAEGPISFITTTTGHLHPEVETRLLTLYTDSSEQQSKTVLRRMAQGTGTLEPMTEEELAQWHAYQDWLKLGPTQVDMPFMKAVAELVPASQPRVRRDFKQLMLLVRVHAVLHQQHRDIENGCIRATLDDYDAVRGTLLDQMAREEGAKVSDGVRAVVQWVRKQAERKQKEQDTSARPSWIEGSPQTGTEWHKLKAQTVTTTAASLAQALGISRSSAGQHAKEACELGYLVNRENRTKQPMQLSLDIPLPDSDDYSHLLPSREQVEQFMRKDGAAVEDAAPTYDWM